eukprot:6178364-Pleurochrysis_carterae.AAC.1
MTVPSNNGSVGYLAAVRAAFRELGAAFRALGPHPAFSGLEIFLPWMSWFANVATKYLSAALLVNDPCCRRHLAGRCTAPPSAVYRCRERLALLALEV